MLSTSSNPQKWIIAITGASGTKYALRLLDVLSDLFTELHVIISDAGLRVLQEEENIKVSQARLSSEILIGRKNPRMFFYNPRDIAATPASGSALFDGMLVIPCTMGTLAAISSGFSQNLIHRAADVCLKEGRKLILVPRETPLSTIHLQNMLKLSQCGVSLVAAMPGFYHKPNSIADIVDMLVMKVLDHMGIENNLSARWGSERDSVQRGGGALVSVK